MTRRLVLAGAGHAHAQVLLDWARAPLPGVEVVVVSPQPLAPYSGMVPGWLAGVYRYEEIAIDMPALCASAGARFVAASVQALEPSRRRLWLDDGRPLDYTLLSLNVGSTLRPPAVDGATVLSLRPLAELRSAWELLLQRWRQDDSTADFTVAAVGGGAAGVESLLAVLARLRALRPDRRVHGGLLSRSASLLPELSAVARRAAARALADAGVTVQLGTDWCAATARGSDLALWATGAQAQAWQLDEARRGGLAVDEQGFVRIDTRLRSVAHDEIFAVGDCARWDAGAPLPKAGVYAVRMGPVLARNLRAALGAGRPVDYRPQRHALVLLATADGRAIASRGRLGAAGAWAWRWKDRIDRRFLARFAVRGHGRRLPSPGTAPDRPGDRRA